MKPPKAMNRLLLAGLCLLSLTAAAKRWEPRVGLNVGPLLSRSLEVTYELTTPDRNGAVFGNVGYAFEREKTMYFRPSPGPTVQEGNQRTDGGFLKAGGKAFVNPQGRLKGFVGIVTVVSQYRNRSRILVSDDTDWPIPGVATDRLTEFRSTNRGWVFSVGAVAGATVRVNSRFDIDLGVQVARPLDQEFDDSVGETAMYFRPGVGPGGKAVALQVILALKYRPHP